MNILVCIKQVPDVEKVKFCPETRTLIREGVENIMNPFDRHALEVALMLKDKVGAKVTHPKFGDGEITEVTPNSSNHCVKIKFEVVGEKMLSLEYAPIEFKD